jgi:hypothetical protein
MSVANDAKAWCMSSAVGLGPGRGLTPEANGPFLPRGCLSFSFVRISAEFLASDAGLVRALAALLR